MAKMAGLEIEVKGEKGWAKIDELLKTKIPRYQAYGKGMRVGLVNAQSINNTSESIHDLITEKNLDLLNISETWLTDRIVEEIQNACPPDYDYDHEDRDMRRGGGVAYIVSKEFGYKTKQTSTKPTIIPTTTFEFIAFELEKKTEKAQPILVINVYRPPPTEKTGEKKVEFFIEFAKVFRPLALKYDCILMTGDFNINVGDKSLGTTLLFNVFFWLFGLEQKVEEPTRHASVNSTILDLVVTRNVQISNLVVDDDETKIADHRNVLFNAAPNNNNNIEESRQWMTKATEKLEKVLLGKHEKK